MTPEFSEFVRCVAAMILLAAGVAFMRYIQRID